MRFIVFISTTLILVLIGIVVWRIWSKVNLSIKREEEAFKAEKKAYRKMKKQVKESEDE